MAVKSGEENTRGRIINSTEVYADVKKLYSHLLEIFEEGRTALNTRPPRTA